MECKSGKREGLGGRDSDVVSEALCHSLALSLALFFFFYLQV